jgi:catechol 2,3-dioxygenase-like lactoylglutathione lyase family enzyme
MLALDHVQIAAPVGCERAAKAYFCDLLGLEMLPKQGETAQSGGCWFRTGSLELHVGVQEGFRPAEKAHAALRSDSVASLKALAEKLIRAGYPVKWDHRLPGTRRFFSADPWGNRFEFLCPLQAHP